MIADIESKNFNVNYYALEIGSRGYILPENIVPHNRKLNRYANLIANIESKNFNFRNRFKRIYFTRKPKQTKTLH